MAGRHRARNKSIQIIRTATVAAKDCKRANVQQFHVRKFNAFLCMSLTSRVLTFRTAPLNSRFLTEFCARHRSNSEVYFQLHAPIHIFSK